MNVIPDDLLTTRRIKIGDDVITAGSGLGITRGKVYKVIAVKGSYIHIKNDRGRVVPQKRCLFLHADQYAVITMYRILKALSIV